MAVLQQLLTESSELEKLFSPSRPLLVSATQHETKFAVRRQSVRWHGARSEEIESPFQRVLGMPGCHDHIVLTLSTEPSLAQFIIEQNFVNDVVESFASISPNAEIDHAPSQCAIAKLRKDTGAESSNIGRNEQAKSRRGDALQVRPFQL